MTAPDSPLIDAARGRDAQQPEALRLADALDCEGHAGMSKAAKELRRQHARIVELEAERRKHQADIEAWKAEAAKAERWRSLALGKDPLQPGKVVQAIQQEAAAVEREACAQVARRHFAQFRDIAGDDLVATIRARKDCS